MNNLSSPMFALLVGINEYESPKVSNLRGCVNDVTAMEKMLSQKYEVPEKNILLLTNQQATNQGIKEAFETHLIAQAKAWEQAGKQDPAPIFLFHFSGHGSQTADSRRAYDLGERDETIVPHDSRINDVRDIKDWELGELIDKLTAPFNNEQANVTIIMDCCHSGSGTRDIKPSLSLARQIEPDFRPQPQRPASNIPTQTRSVGASGWMQGEKYVLLAGCRNDQLSYEIIVTPTVDTPQSHGALTYYTLQEFNKTPANSRLTYRQLHERVRYNVNSAYEEQTPQCEGQKDRQLFGGLVAKQSAMLTVIDKRDGLIWVDGGLAHGLTKGSQLTVYPSEGEKSRKKNQPVATLYVQEVGAVKSGCKVESGAKDIELHAKAKIAYLDHSDMQRRVVLDIPELSLKRKIAALLLEENVSSYLKQVTADQPADLRIEQVDENIEIQDSTGKRMVAPFSPEKLVELPNDLVHLARYHNALHLDNTDSSSELAKTVKVEIKALDLDGDQPAAVSITPNADGNIEIETGQKIVIEATNNSEEDLYLAVFDFSDDWSITQLYPRMSGSHKAVKANGGQLSLGLTRKRKEQLSPGLPEGSDHAREFIKVYATRTETEYDMLQMGSLKSGSASRTASVTGKQSPLTHLLQHAANGGTSRAITAPPPTAADEWTTAEMQFYITQRKA